MSAAQAILDDLILSDEQKYTRYVAACKARNMVPMTWAEWLDLPF